MLMQLVRGSQIFDKASQGDLAICTAQEDILDRDDLVWCLVTDRRIFGIFGQHPLLCFSGLPGHRSSTCNPERTCDRWSKLCGKEEFRLCLFWGVCARFVSSTDLKIEADSMIDRRGGTGISIRCNICRVRLVALDVLGYGNCLVCLHCNKLPYPSSG
jgi:hypothetical protein